MKLFRGLLLIFLIPFIYTQECTPAQSLYDAGSYLEAYQEIIGMGDTVFENDECTLLAYNILFKLENFIEARKYLNKLITSNPNNTNYKDLNDLLEKVKRSLLINKDLERFDVDLADDTIEKLKKILMDDELNSISKFYFYLGTAYKKKFMNSSLIDSMDFELLDLSIENYQKAQNINTQYDKDILNISKYLTNIGKTSMNNDRLEQALVYFSKAIEYDSDYSTAHFYLGDLYRKIQDYDLAIESFEAGLGSKVKNGNYKILYLLGTCYQRLNKLDMAERIFEYSINNEPTYIKARFALANVYYKQQDYAKSQSIIFDILNMDSEYIKAYELLVNIYLDKNDYTSARKYSNDGILIDSKSYFLYSQLAFIDNQSCLDENGSFISSCENIDSVISNANKALSLKRNYGPALIELGRLYTFLCNSVAAEDNFKKAKRYDRRQVNILEDWAAGYSKEKCK